jgi:hypothetical protein
MGYCSRIDIQNIIAQSMTSATTAPATFDSPTMGMSATKNLIMIGDIGKSFDKNVISDDVVDSYIQIADSTIDAKFSQLYKTPFTELVDLEAILYSPIEETYNPDTFVLDKSYPINPGDIIIIVSQGIENKYTIDTITSPTTYTVVEDIYQDYPDGSRVVRVSYPKPIRWISARMAAANIYDKYFSAEVSPNTSAYGKYLRQLARQDVNDILNGRTILHGQQRIGRRFYNSNIVEQYDLPKGNDGSKDIGEVNV